MTRHCVTCIYDLHNNYLLGKLFKTHCTLNSILSLVQIAGTPAITQRTNTQFQGPHYPPRYICIYVCIKSEEEEVKGKEKGKMAAKEDDENLRSSTSVCHLRIIA